MPPSDRAESTPWPLWPLQLRQESSHEEGGQREWSVATTKFTGDADGNVTTLHAVRVGPAPKFEPIPGSEFTLDADLVLLAMGFTGPVKDGMIEQLGEALRRHLRRRKAARLRDFHRAADCADDLGAGAIAERQVQHHAGVAGGFCDGRV